MNKTRSRLVAASFPVYTGQRSLKIYVWAPQLLFNIKVHSTHLTELIHICSEGVL